MPQDLAASACVYNNVVTIRCIPIVVQNLLFWAIALAGIVALVLIIVGGFKFITSGGEKEKVEGARKTLTYAIIGLILILISFGVVRLIGQITGTTCINAPFDFSNCGLKGTSGAVNCQGDGNAACGNNPNLHPICDTTSGEWQCKHD